MGDLVIELDARYKVKLVMDRHEHSSGGDSNGFKWLDDPVGSHTCNSATLLQDVQDIEVWFETNITPSGRGAAANVIQLPVLIRLRRFQ